MKAMAEVDGNAMRIRESQMLLERDVTPLRREVERALQKHTTTPATAAAASTYQAPTDPMSGGTDNGGMMESLIQNSEDLLRESQTVLAETEYIGNQTLLQMGEQREQLQNAQGNLVRIQHVAEQARHILVTFQRRACRSRFGLYITITVLVAANVFVLYCIYRKHREEANGGGDDSSNRDDDNMLGHVLYLRS